jgi:hypothetical protein
MLQPSANFHWLGGPKARLNAADYFKKFFFGFKTGEPPAFVGW